MLRKRMGKRILFPGCLVLAICCWNSLAMATTLKVADAYLKAAWMAGDEKNRLAAQRFRQQAIRHFALALEGRAVKDDLLSDLTYLVGDLYRRIGNFTEALQWFDRVQAAQPWLAALVKQ